MCVYDNIACVITGYMFLMQSDVCLAISAAKVLSTCLWVTYSIGELLPLSCSHLVSPPFSARVYISAI